MTDSKAGEQNCKCTHGATYASNKCDVSCSKGNVKCPGNSKCKDNHDRCDWYTVENKVPVVREKAPYFEGKAVYNGQIKDVSLNDYKGKYLVLFFYPHDFSFVCPTEIMAFSDEIELFRKINCEVVAASTDSVFSHLEWTLRPRSEGGLGAMNIPILADVSKQIAGSYGALIRTDPDMGAAFRATYIIDEDQRLRTVHIHDTQIGRSTSEVRRLVEALIFHKKNGDVCPANWNPGDQVETRVRLILASDLSVLGCTLQDLVESRVHLALASDLPASSCAFKDLDKSRVHLVRASGLPVSGCTLHNPDENQVHLVLASDLQTTDSTLHDPDESRVHLLCANGLQIMDRTLRDKDNSH